ncbi:MAG: hypothetical protein EZS28_041132 [Streblomastix strix]|uniref:Uncharacterized protein n=1 Tax=Streblomastix strix TaxID=222440 RepID=A0A5J4TZX9_9EUKA|nr:MAG: hypothetical protein EZS28_041132 [Streblomastix strix]
MIHIFIQLESLQNKKKAKAVREAQRFTLIASGTMIDIYSEQDCTGPTQSSSISSTDSRLPTSRVKLNEGTCTFSPHLVELLNACGQALSENSWITF